MQEITSLRVRASVLEALIGLGSQIERSPFMTVLSAGRRHDVWRNHSGRASGCPVGRLGRGLPRVGVPIGFVFLRGERERTRWDARDPAAVRYI